MAWTSDRATSCCLYVYIYIVYTEIHIYVIIYYYYFSFQTTTKRFPCFHFLPTTTIDIITYKCKYKLNVNTMPSGYYFDGNLKYRLRLSKLQIKVSSSLRRLFTLHLSKALRYAWLLSHTDLFQAAAALTFESEFFCPTHYHIRRQTKVHYSSSVIRETADGISFAVPQHQYQSSARRDKMNEK